MGGNETMTDKRFKLRKDGKIEWWHEHPTNIYVCPNMEYATEILNEQDQKIKELKRMLKLVSESESVRNENSVKEIVRNKLFGLDSVAGESANAFNDYLMLNKFFKEYYNEHWGNDKFD